MAEIEQITEFKFHSLPLARIKKIMKADEDVRMIVGEAPVVFAKACKMFILELTLRAWLHTEENKRTLQKNDIAAAITGTDILDFLVDIMPTDELKDDSVGLPNTALQSRRPWFRTMFRELPFPSNCIQTSSLSHLCGRSRSSSSRPQMVVKMNNYS